MSLFGIPDDDRRALVPVTDQVAVVTDSVDEDLNLTRDEGPRGMTYTDVVSFVRRKKCMIGFIVTGIIIFLALIITTVSVTTGPSAPVVVPTTPAPTSTSTSTTTTTTTSTTTTPKSTTTSTTTEHTTTTTTSSTTPSTTTTSTTERTTTTTTTTHAPFPPAPTVHPVPPNATALDPITLINQVFPGRFKWFPHDCVATSPQSFKFTLIIDKVSHNYTAESRDKTDAKRGASILAAKDLFGIVYNISIPKPIIPCHDLSNTEDSPVQNPISSNDTVERDGTQGFDSTERSSVTEDSGESTTSKPEIESSVPTVHPLPPHPEELPPTTLIDQVFTGKLNWTQDSCVPTNPPAWKFTLSIEGISRNYTAESDEKKHAKTAVSMLVAEDLFGIKYNYTMPKPLHPCISLSFGGIDPRSLPIPEESEQENTHESSRRK